MTKYDSRARRVVITPFSGAGRCRSVGEVPVKRSDPVTGTVGSKVHPLLGGRQPHAGISLPEVGLLIRPPYVDWILDGQKTWEIRSKRTARRGRIGLIRSASGLVVGEAELIDVVGPLTYTDLRDNAAKLNITPPEAWEPEGPTFAWALRGAKRYRTPVPYTHRSGAVIWARLG